MITSSSERNGVVVSIWALITMSQSERPFSELKNTSLGFDPPRNEARCVFVDSVIFDVTPSIVVTLTIEPLSVELIGIYYDRYHTPLTTRKQNWAGRLSTSKACSALFPIP
ncbi:hypothetical protein PM082_023379 [Marasmius tenuissimus]|nr:hypothetical protein PM082_023379 [Marasmius tenuissimus]